MDNAELRYVDTAEEAAAFVRWLGERRPVLAIDTETASLTGWWRPDFCRLVQFGDGKAAWALSVRDWRGAIDEALSKYDGPTAFVNVKFDLHALEGAGLPIPPIHKAHDAGIMDRLLEPRRAHSLKGMADRYWPGSSAGQALLKDAMARNHWTWATVPVDLPLYWQYAGLDTVLTARLAEKLWPLVNAEGYRAAYDREMAVIGILYQAEKRGLRIDPSYTSNLREEWVNEMDTLSSELNDLGLENPNAGRQVALAMQQTENWEPDDYTETGQIKVDASVLNGIDSEISRRVLRYRRLRKWTGTYLDTFLRDRDENDRVHASINTFQAKTGRMSITGPPLQTLPRGAIIRNCVLPPDGDALWAIDYDTMEMRAFAHYSQEQALIAAIQSGQDLHTYAAQEVYQDPTITKKDERRQLAKNTQFGLVYGAGPAKTAETAGVTVEEAKSFLAAYEERFPGVRPFMRSLDGVARERLVREGRAYVRSHGGRILTADPAKLYVLVNYLIQGSCADIFKDKIIAVDAAGFGDNIVLPVHDELLLRFEDGDTESPAEVGRIMEDDQALCVPLSCEITGPLTRWGAKYGEDS